MIRRRPPSKPVEEDTRRSFDDFELRLGDVMRGERATLGKSLLDVQRELKIKATYIAAIENSDPSAFESPGFIAGYVRSYARYLGLDPEWAFASFCKEAEFVTVAAGEAGLGRKAKAKTSAGGSTTAKVVAGLGSKMPSGSSAPAKEPNPFREPAVSFAPAGEAMLSRVEPGAIGSTLVLLALIGGLGYGGWAVLQQVQRVDVTPVDQAPGALAQVDPLSGPGLADTSAPEFAGLEPVAPDALDRLYRPQALDTPVMVARDGPIAAIDPGLGGIMSPGQGPEAQRVAALAEAVQLEVAGFAESGLVMVAVRPAWVRVKDAAGKVIFESTMAPGDTYTVPEDAQAPVLRAGAAGGVYFAVDGRVYGPAGPAGTVAGAVDLSREAITGAYQVADLSLDPALAEILDQNGVSAPGGDTLFAQAAPVQPPVLGLANPGADLPRVTSEGAPDIMVVATGDTWVQIRSEDGSVIYESVMKKGDRYNLSGEDAFAKLRTGFGGHVYFVVDGQTFGPAGGNGEVVRNVAMTAEALTTSYSVADLTQNAVLREVLVAESQ
ncbi:DUF4115 domain-containing protein [Alphaproteobacteria bacterium KMM 3653]|uniref:DUF4115 domain-containing protein n=1 Tax=Harenicola maris TaxID=2841044 RepID=A0AAP2CL40_9RHOB|nr:DUF4115 domain-containing protein [Harenicola maris]